MVSDLFCLRPALRESDTFASGQGVEMAAACGACPETMATLSQAPTMRGCSLGYAFFSVLAPGTRIEPHCALHPLFLDRSATSSPQREFSWP